MTQGKVLALYISTGDPKLPREEKETIHVDENGVLGDKFYAKDPNRSVLLTFTGSYNLAQNEGIDLAVGKLGENIYIDINPYELPCDAKIKIGEVVFEVSQHCTLCKGLSSIDAKLPKLLKNDRGIFIRPLTKGSIKVGDKVVLQ